LEKILQYIYGDVKCHEFESFELTWSVILAASEYMLEDYEEICAINLESQLKKDNFVDLYNLAVLLNNKKLLEAVRKFACGHPNNLNPTNACFTTKENNVTELELEAFNDYFKHCSKFHPNHAILQFDEYFTQYKR